MYCSSCGGRVVPGLSYCNHCGAKLIGETGDKGIKSSEAKAGTVVWAMVAALVFGFAGIVCLMMAMKIVGLDVNLILVLTILSFLMLLLVESVFIWQLVRRQPRAERVDTPLSKEHARTELEEAQARALPEFMPSVTEHATRPFEPVQIERKLK